MSPLTPRRTAAAVAALVVGSAVLAGVRVWLDRPSELTSAIALAPAGTARYSWTDWAGVRAELDAGGLDAGSSRAEVADFLERAYEQDLSSASVLDDAAGLLQDGFGFSPATLDWELLAQGPEGLVVIGGLPEGSDPGQVEEHLRGLGFAPPGGGGDVWSGAEADLTGIDPTSQSMPLLTQVAVEEEHGVVVTGDDQAYVQEAVDRLGSADVPGGVVRSAGALEGTLSALVTTGDYACSEMSFVDSDPTTTAQAEQLVEAAGGVSPMRGFGLGVMPGGTGEDERPVRTAMDFDSDERARRNADSRAKLAVGPAPGQGGTFAERFTLGEVAARGTVVTMDLEPLPGQTPFSDLMGGTVLFASC